MKSLKVLSMFTITALALTATAAPTGGGKGGKEGRTGLEGREDNLEKFERANSARLGNIAQNPNGVKALDMASQILLKRPATLAPDATRVGLAEGILSGAISKDQMETLIESVGTNSQSKNIADALYAAAANGLISKREQVIISEVDGNAITDATGKAVTVNSLDAWFNHGKTVADGKWESNTAAAKFNEFSQKIETSINNKTAKSWLDAARKACEELGIKWEDFIRLCLLKK